MSSKLFDLSGRRALITGSSQGIGFALAQGLIEAGAKVVLNGRDKGKLAEASAALGGVDTLAFDVTDHEGVRAAVDAAEAGGMAFDILINNAGMQYRTEFRTFRRMPSRSFCRRISQACFMWARRLRGT